MGAFSGEKALLVTRIVNCTQKILFEYVPVSAPLPKKTQHSTAVAKEHLSKTTTKSWFAADSVEFYVHFHWCVDVTSQRIPKQQNI